MPTELIRLCQQNRGMYVPARSAAAMISSPLRAVNGRPLIVIGTAFGIRLRRGCGGSCGLGRLRPAPRSRAGFGWSLDSGVASRAHLRPADDAGSRIAAA